MNCLIHVSAFTTHNFPHKLVDFKDNSYHNNLASAYVIAAVLRVSNLSQTLL